MTPAAKREATAHLQKTYAVSQRRACSVLKADRATVRYVRRRPDDAALRAKIRALATDGRRFRILAVVDDFTRECLALVADTSLSGARVARELDAVIAARGRPYTCVSDNVLH